MSAQLEEGLDAVLARARSAIDRAKALSQQFTQAPSAVNSARGEVNAAEDANSSISRHIAGEQQLCAEQHAPVPHALCAQGQHEVQQDSQSDPSTCRHATLDSRPCAQQQVSPNCATSYTTCIHANSHDIVDDDSEPAAASSPVATPPRPLLDVACRLAILQQQQKNTLAQLLGLRLEQLRLRQQQLAALQELLRAEADAVEGTPMQMQAVNQALALLGTSLEDMDLAATAISATTADGVAQVAHTVARADQRAEDISRMARQLLTVLREFPRRGEALLPVRPVDSGPRGASEQELGELAVQSCDGSHPLLGELCSICLAEFAPGDVLSGVGCQHLHHKVCLHEWLRIRACCPLCKMPLPSTVVPGSRGGDGDGEGGVLSQDN